MTAPKPSRKLPEQDALSLLKRDHKIVARLFDLFDAALDYRDKKLAALKICRVLAVHMAIEEELLYPQAHKALQDDEGVHEAEVEHLSAKVLIADIESLSATDEKYDATVKVLGEYIRHHVKEEEADLFPQLRRTDLDLEAIGSQLAARRLELLAQQDIQEDELPDVHSNLRSKNGSAAKNAGRKNGAHVAKAAIASGQRDRRLHH